MQIQFTNDAPEYSGRELTLAFMAMVDGEPVQCHITAEALEDHFGAASPRFEDMVGAFDTHRPASRPLRGACCRRRARSAWC
ncbi:hypothetical protein C7S16_4856 [Burkholderia thailandensis]|uniref:DUF1488 domain-containing protein n=1 Tax=Burkholderia thailandensis TaxID=57975 RepID=A0AAW9CUC9_BURTH|nr:hypothetical protein [Burkholderia thailandensis]